jgi:hypothetical protein
MKSEAYASINFSVAENWTDGKMIGTLYNRDGQMRSCICGHLFFLRDAMTDIVIMKNDPNLSADSIPSAKFIKDDELNALLKSQSHELEIEITLRKRLWQFSNDSFRETYREYKKSNKDSFPTYSLTIEQTENLERLKELLISQNSDNLLMLIEINRALGYTKEALNCLKNLSKDEESFVNMMTFLIDSKYRGPARYRS